jgi:tetratricopeptide (TPR) repeat protein
MVSARRARKAAPPAPPLAGPLLGSASSAAALGRLERAVGELKARQVEPILRNAVAALKRNDAAGAAAFAMKALGADERNGLGWYLLAVARDMAGDLANALKAYETALLLLPDHAELANDLGRLAFRLGMKPVAEKLFRHYLAKHPESFEAANNLACALRDQQRFEDAIDALRPAIERNPDNAMLWNTLGTVLSERGDPAGAQTFFDEALRFDPLFAKARYNRGNSRLALGDLDQALADCDLALSQTTLPEERAMMTLARSTIQIANGAIAQGWADYEARLDPQFAGATHFLIDRPRWKPGDDLAGRSLLLMGEQGLGDEVLFANFIPDLIERLGPQGRLTIAVEPRLIPLFSRAFPSAVVGAHTTFTVEGGRTCRAAPFVADWHGIDLWAPMASLLIDLRPSVESFPPRTGFLPADPIRVAHWRKVLEKAPPGLKVGMLWKSMKLDGARHRYFSPFDAWAPVLSLPGLSLINLQYGDCSAELAAAKNAGIEIWTPPGIDLKQDLDEVSALACALDLTIGFANATTNLAAAAGAPVWLVSTPGAWPRLGTQRYPWYPQARVFLPPGFGQWDAVMNEVAAALAAEIRRNLKPSLRV